MSAYVKQLSAIIATMSSEVGISYEKLIDITGKVPNRYQIPTACGELFTEGLLKDIDIAVARTTASTDTMLDIHNHTETEILYVKKGKVIITFDDSEIKTINQGDIFVIPAGRNHGAYWPEESEFIVLTIPASPSWPEDPHG